MRARGEEGGSSPGVGCANLGVMPLLALFLIGDAMDGRADRCHSRQGTGEHEVHVTPDKKNGSMKAGGQVSGTWHVQAGGTHQRHH